MPADFTSRGRDRGTCSVCGREYEITAKGVVRRHRRAIVTVGRVRTMGCDGSGRPPAGGGV